MRAAAMSYSIGGKRTSSGQASDKKHVGKKLANTNGIPTSSRFDAPEFTPALPPKSNPWNRPPSKLPSGPASPGVSINDPPLPSQAQSEKAESAARSSNSSGIRNNESSPSVPVGGYHGPDSKAPTSSSQQSTTHHTTCSDNNTTSSENDGSKSTEQIASDSNPWFSSSNPFSGKTKSELGSPEPSLTDLSLPPIPETASQSNDSGSNQPTNRTPSNVSESTILNSPVENEDSLAAEDAVTNRCQEEEPLPPKENQTEETTVANAEKDPRPPSRESVHSLTSADTARQTARSASFSSEDSRKVPTTLLTALQGDER